MLGKRIKKLRSEQNISQLELGKKLNVVKTTVSARENGVSSPYIDTLVSISKIFDLSANYLLGIENVKNKVKDIYEVPIYRSGWCLNPFLGDEDII